MLLHVSTVVLFISGIANIFLIKAGKKLKPEHKMWVHFFEVKFLLALCLSPILNFPLRTFTSTQEELDTLRFKVQFYIVVFIYFYSTLIKYFREEVCNNFN